MILNMNDGTSKDPYLRIDLNMGNCDALPDFSKGPKGNLEDKHAMIKKAGYQGVQSGDPAYCKKYELALTEHARLDKIGELDDKIMVWKDSGVQCTTLHVGSGMENDHDIDLFLDYLINLSEKTSYPLYIETHRATITQDMYRTVQLVERFPDVRFNGDFSHWYTGQEMPYGNLDEKLEFISPVLERVRFIHGRIGNPSHIQVNIGKGNGLSFVDHFREFWTRSMAGFLRSAEAGDFFVFCPELLPANIHYAYGCYNDKGEFVEESDRWEQALVLADIARQCWEDASNIQ